MSKISKAILPNSATRGCSRANLSISAARGASWPICQGVLTDQSTQVRRQGGTPAQNGHQRALKGQ